MIVLLRSTDGNPDSRLQKYIDFIERATLPYCTICWDRDNRFQNNEKHIYYQKRALYGSGWKNIKGLLGFNLFLFRWLLSHRKDIHIIHACDFDTILPAILMGLLFHKKVIYDIFDWYADSRNLGFLQYFVLLLERINLKCADVTIICEEERIKQLCCAPKCLWVLPNIPNLNQIDIGTDLLNGNDSIIRLSYVGILSRSRGLEKILKYLAGNTRYSLDIAGFGELKNLVEKYADSCNNIIYHGTVPYSEGLKIMKKSDLILALYETNIPNHIYAAPNKYYEGLFLGIPILTTKGTLVGEKTEKLETGFAIGEDYNDICAFFDQLSINRINVLGYNAKKYWRSIYADYVSRFMQEKYLPYIEKRL